MFDFGFSADTESKSEINAAIDQLDKTFDLVMIQNYFDESLILLKELLGLTFLDIVSFKTNARTKPDQKLSKAVKQEILDWNHADSQLFLHFNATFWRKVSDFGLERMAAEVILL